MGDSLHFCLSVVSIQTFPPVKVFLVSQLHVSSSDVSELRIRTHSRQKVRAHHVFDDVQNTCRNVFTVVLLLNRNNEVHDQLYELHQDGVTLYNTSHFTYKVAQFDRFSLADCPLLISKDEASQEVLLKQAYVILHLQLLHRL